MPARVYHQRLLELRTKLAGPLSDARRLTAQALLLFVLRNAQAAHPTTDFSDLNAMTPQIKYPTVALTGCPAPARPAEHLPLLASPKADHARGRLSWFPIVNPTRGANGAYSAAVDAVSGDEAPHSQPQQYK